MMKEFWQRAGLLTQILAVLSLAVSLLTWWGTQQSVLWFNFDWQLIKQGEVYRLLTPTFIHFMVASLPIHLIFNVLWLWELGGRIEKYEGTGSYFGLIMFTAIGSNVIQALTYNGSFSGFVGLFGGLSGVVYGLLGYMAVRHHFDKNYRLSVPLPILQFMLIWLVLGFTGLIGSIANGAHLGGLVLGAIYAWSKAQLSKVKR